MDFSWTEEQQALRDQVIAFAETELNPGFAEREQAGAFHRGGWQRCADFGILRSFMPAEYGGQGMDMVTTIGMMEALGYGCPDNGLTLGLNGQMWSIQEPILQFGNEEQKHKFLPGLGDGSLFGAHGMTEPESGSDAFSLKTTAVRKDGGYVLNGRKAYIGLAPIADVALVFASTDPELGSWGISVFLVETDTPGCTLSAPREKMGLRTNPLGDIFLEDCFVPKANRLGPERIGMTLFNQSMDYERSFIFASHVGTMGRQLDQCIEFASQRELGGTPIGSHQAVSHRIAEMKLRLETSQLLLYKLAWMKERGDPAALEAALANLHHAESIATNSLDAMRIHGARGYLTEFGIEHSVRDGVGGVIYSGTSDIQRNIIAKLLGL